MSESSDARTLSIIGFLTAGAVILGIGFFVSNRPSSDPGGETLPELRVLAPADGDSVDNPLTLEFSTPAELRLTQAGWVAGELHLHVMVDQLELMPAAADVTGGDGTYAWRLPPLEPGSRRVYLTWAGRHHGNLDTPADTVTLHVR